MWEPGLELNVLYSSVVEENGDGMWGCRREKVPDMKYDRVL